METLAGFPYAEIEFGKRGEVVKRDSFDALLGSLAQGDAAPQVIVLAHGWNNDMDDARRLYSELAQRLREVLDASPPPGLPAGPLSLLGVLWPSKKFAESALVAGGAASAAGEPLGDAALVARLDEIRDVFDAPDAEQRIDEAKGLVDRLEDSPAARDRFVELTRGLVPEAADDDVDDFARAFRGAPGREVLAQLEAPVLPVGDAEAETTGGNAAAVGDAGGAAAFSLSLGGIKAAAERFLNLTTYYQMKERAGVVGANGLNPRLRELRSRRADAGLHLVGHSFGGRLVTAATAGLPGQPGVPQDTLTLLQAAFSHYGFADDYEAGHDGFFRRVVADGMVRGPILITHSMRDTAVGYAYPLASRLARQVATGLGDANDRYGGIGRNGAQRTPEARQGKLSDVGTPYDFAAARVHNLNADTVILDHSDIRKPQVAYAILSAVASAQS